MSVSTAPGPLALDRIWYTRCPVPTASGLAYNLGWLREEYATEGIDIEAWVAPEPLAAANELLVRSASGAEGNHVG